MSTLRVGLIYAYIYTWVGLMLISWDSLSLVLFLGPRLSLTFAKKSFLIGHGGTSGVTAAKSDITAVKVA